MSTPSCPECDEAAPRMVCVEWEDSVHPRPKWEWLDELKGPSVSLCRTVGWLMSEDSKQIRIALTLGGKGDECQVAGIMAIPAKAVVNISPLSAASEEVCSVYQVSE